VNFKVEIGIDVDPKRKIWLVGDVGKVELSELKEAAIAVTEAITLQALTARAIAMGDVEVDEDAAKIVEMARKAAADQVPPSERRPRPEDPESMRAFGEDDDEEEHAD
jgi:hypothetical protein